MNYIGPCLKQEKEGNSERVSGRLKFHEPLCWALHTQLLLEHLEVNHNSASHQLITDEAGKSSLIEYPNTHISDYGLTVFNCHQLLLILVSSVNDYFVSLLAQNLKRLELQRMLVKKIQISGHQPTVRLRFNQFKDRIMIQFVLGPNFKHFKGTPQDEDERSWLRIMMIRFIFIMGWDQGLH